MGFADTLADTVKDATCALLGQFEDAAAALDRVVGGFGTGANEKLWRQLNRKVCDRREPPGPPPPKGGQCDGIKYALTTKWLCVTSTACATTVRTVSGVEMWGPIQSIRVAPNPNAATNHNVFITARHTSPTSPIVEALRFNVTHIRVSACDPDPKLIEFTPVRLSPGTGVCDEEYLPPPPPSPGWNIINYNNFTWIDDSGDTVVEDLQLTFGFAYINADLDIEIPVRVDVGGIEFNANFNFDKGSFDIDFGDINFNFNRPDNPDVRGPDNDDRDLPDSDDNAPDNPNDIEDDDDVIEDDEPVGEEIVRTSTIRAIRVVVTDVGDFVDELFQNRNPNIAIPNYGYVQFFVRTEEDAGGWTADIPVKNRNHFIPCPWEGGALLVRGTARPGVNWTIKAYRQKTRDVIAFPEGT